MSPLLLAISAFDRIGQGLLAVLLCLPVLIVWVFLLVMGGYFWNRLTLPKRRRAMGGMITLSWITTCLFLFVVPSTDYEFDLSKTPDEDVPYTEFERIGITFWYVKSTRFESSFSPISPGTTSTEFSVVGILAILPLFIALGMLGRWLYCFLPTRYRRPEDRCDHCDYQLTGITSPVCPECGEVIT